MPGEGALYALRKQTFTTALTTAGERGAATFRAHASAEPVLLFPRSFGALQCPFHNKSRVRRDGAGMLRRFSGLSIEATDGATQPMGFASAVHFWNKERSERESQNRAGD